MSNFERINEVLADHHRFVREECGMEPVMTVLVGSQNYGLATENSDYDTFTFVMPTINQLATMRDAVSTTIEAAEGHINIKDIRTALNLLKKTNPNSVECFASRYYITESRYSDLIERLRDPLMLRCDTKHMLIAIGGMAHQMKKRNMSPGKRLSHILRMQCMIDNYFSLGSDILSLGLEQHYRALQAKKDPDNPQWDAECEAEEAIVQEMIKRHMPIGKDIAEDEIKKKIENIQEEFIRRIFI